jgi:hypothetical protein
MQKSTAEDTVRELLEKTAAANAPIFVTLQKDAGAVIRAGRLAAGAPEGVIMKAMGLDPTKPDDVTTYTNFENDSQYLEITTDSLTAIAKAIKANPVDLAVKIINSADSDDGGATGPDGSTPGAPPADGSTPPTPPAAGGATPAQKSEQQLAARAVEKLTKEERDVLNKSMLGSRQVKVTGAENKIEKSAEVQKIEKRRDLEKAIMSLKPDARERIEKGAVIIASDFEAGTLTEAQAQEMFEITAPQTLLLNRVQTVTMNALNQEVMLMGVTSRTARRFASRTVLQDSDNTQMVGVKRTMTAQDMDLAYSLEDTIRLNYQNRLPQLESQISNMMFTNYGVQAEDLAINGTSATYASSFLTLGKGWLQIVIDNATSGNAWRFISSATTTYPEVYNALDALKKAIVTNKPIYTRLPYVFIMSPADFDSYERWRVSLHIPDNAIAGGVPKQYSGLEIIVSPLMAPGNFIYTPLLNLVYAYVSAGNAGVRIRQFDNVKATDILLSIAQTFDLVDYDATIAATVTGAWTH